MTLREAFILARRRGVEGPQHVALTWHIEPAGERPGWFAASLNIVRQGPTHMQYADAWADLKQHGRLTVSGTWYEMCDDKASGNILARKSKEQPK